MQQHRRRAGGKHLRCHQLGRRFAPYPGGNPLEFRQRIAGPLDLPDGQVGIGVNQAGGKADLQIPVRQIEFHFLRGLLRLTAEIVVLGQCNILAGTIFHLLNAGHTLSRRERGIQQRHQLGRRGDGGGRRNHRRSRFGRRLPPGIPGFFGIGRNLPRDTKLLRTGNTPLRAVFLHQPLGDFPRFGGLPYRSVFFRHRLHPPRSGSLLRTVWTGFFHVFPNLFGLPYSFSIRPSRFFGKTFLFFERFL